MHRQAFCCNGSTVTGQPRRGF